MSIDDDRPEFSVAVFFRDETYIYMARFVSALTASGIFKAAIRGAPENVARIIITDGGDCTNAEWIRGKGLTYPTPDMIEGQPETTGRA